MVISNNNYEKVVPFIIFILALVLLFKLIQPMITIILGSILLTYVTFPIYSKIMKKIHIKPLSIILSLVIVTIIILIPFTFLAIEITREGYSFYNSLSNTSVQGELFGYGCISVDSKICMLLNQAEIFNKEHLSTIDFEEIFQNILPLLKEKIIDFTVGIPILLAQVFLTLILSYLLMNDWENILKKIVYILPLRTKTTNRLTKEFAEITHTVIFAQLFVAIVQGIIGGVGFYIFGIPFPLFLGVLMAFCALIPSIGTTIIWIPASFFLIISGYFSQNNLVLGKGIGLFLYGFLIISTIDNILLTYIVHAKAKVKQIIVIIGVIGGTAMFGVLGIFIGPILLPLLLTYFETFKERFV